ncbi:hypothetical protein [Streptomyces sp. NPDC059918]|uniref:hypothetical protein n=1 Tax=unclassified Streptomyces TaxID=2593676 RepID=UPI0036647F53
MASKALLLVRRAKFMITNLRHLTSIYSVTAEASGTRRGPRVSQGSVDPTAGISEIDESRRQEHYRVSVKIFDEIEDDLRTSRTLQRIYLLCLMGGITLTFLLGYTVIVGLWKTQPVFTRWAGLIIVNGLWIAMGWALWKNRKKLVDRTGALRNALQDRQTAAAMLPLDSPSGLRIYREASLDLIDQYRKSANKNRHVHNFFQGIIITGSIITSTLAAMNEGSSQILRLSTALSVHLSEFLRESLVILNSANADTISSRRPTILRSITTRRSSCSMSMPAGMMSRRFPRLIDSGCSLAT